MACALVCKAWLVCGLALLYEDTKLLIDAHIQPPRLASPSDRLYKIGKALAQGELRQPTFVRSMSIVGDYECHKHEGKSINILSAPLATRTALWRDSEGAQQLLMCVHEQSRASSQGTYAVSCRRVAPHVMDLQIESQANGPLLAFARATSLHNVAFPALRELDLHLMSSSRDERAPSNFDLGTLLRHFRNTCQHLTLSFKVADSRQNRPFVWTHEDWCFANLTRLRLVEPPLAIQRAALKASMASLTTLQYDFSPILGRKSTLSHLVANLVAVFKDAADVPHVESLRLKLPLMFKAVTVPASEPQDTIHAVSELLQQLPVLRELKLVLKHTLNNISVTPALLLAPSSLRSLELAWDAPGWFKSGATELLPLSRSLDDLISALQVGELDWLQTLTLRDCADPMGDMNPNVLGPSVRTLRQLCQDLEITFTASEHLLATDTQA